MIIDSSDAPIGLLLSGGLDSCILAGRLLEEGRRVRPFYIDSQLVWQQEELLALKEFLGQIAGPQLEELLVLRLPLDDLYDGHWSVTGCEVPDAASADDAVYLPGRNALLVIKAALWCALHGIEELALAVLQSNPFSDATEGFFSDFEAALNCAAGSRVHIVRPFAGLDKQQVMRLGRNLPLQATFSCIAPTEGLHCGRCNKCAERRAAFRAIEADDPTEYAPSTQSDE